MTSLADALRSLEEAIREAVREQVRAALDPLRPASGDGLLSVRDAAGWLDVSERRVRDLIAAGELEFIEGLGKGGHGRPGRKVPIDSLRAYVARSARTAPAPTPRRMRRRTATAAHRKETP